MSDSVIVEKRCSFVTWLARQTTRDDARGEMARRIVRDRSANGIEAEAIHQAMVEWACETGPDAEEAPRERGLVVGWS